MKNFFINIAIGFIKSYVLKMTPDIRIWLKNMARELQKKAAATPNKFDDIVAALIANIFR